MREVVQLKELFDEPLKFDAPNSQLVSTLLNVPTFKTDGDFRIGLDRIMQHMFEEAGEDKVVRAVLDYLKTNCKTLLLEELARITPMPKVSRA